MSSSKLVVGCGDEEESMSMSMPSSKLPLLSLIFPFPVRSPDNNEDDASSSGSSTPPFHSSASVPFKWEEEPGKPIINHCTALIPPFAQQPLYLHLIPPPPSRSTKKTPSPTTVLDGPPSPQTTGLLVPIPMVRSHSEQKSTQKKKKKKRLFGSWSWGSSSRTSPGNCKKMVVVVVVGERDTNMGSGPSGGSFVFSYSSSTAAFSFSFDDVGRECCSEYGGESVCCGWGGGEEADEEKQELHQLFSGYAMEGREQVKEKWNFNLKWRLLYNVVMYASSQSLR